MKKKKKPMIGGPNGYVYRDPVIQIAHIFYTLSLDYPEGCTYTQ